jgi:hypothetical protein
VRPCQKHPVCILREPILNRKHIVAPLHQGHEVAADLQAGFGAYTCGRAGVPVLRYATNGRHDPLAQDAVG